ncbi:hypothetical protein AB205_0079830 [Aquarana catesbeiana]|uniref:Uncharacterized protein n=1 Tax=Aquarana catesbeiana TaxID=8400 RepID=A0A2G9Q1I9_AQUCT|nr:hypothetical protein AB205_0079830 [Aquarana catesbeiana]
MFHIPIPGLKYLCAKYTFCFILIGEKRLRQPEPRDPRPHQPIWEISRSPTEDVEEGEVGDMCTPPGDVVVEGEEVVEAGPSASVPPSPEDVDEG